MLKYNLTSIKDFDPVKHILEHIPSEENELEYFEKQVRRALVLVLPMNRVQYFVLRGGIVFPPKFSCYLPVFSFF